MSFTNNRIDFRNNSSYNQEMMAYAHGKGQMSVVTNGLELTPGSKWTITAGLFFNNGIYGQLGAKGEIQELEISSTYTGFLHIKSFLDNTNPDKSISTLTFSATRTDTDKWDVSGTKYFCIYSFSAGKINADYRKPTLNQVINEKHGLATITRFGTGQQTWWVDRNETLKGNLFKYLQLYAGMNSQYGGDYIGLNSQLKTSDNTTISSYLLFRHFLKKDGKDGIALEGSVPHNDENYTKNLANVCFLGNLYNEDGTMNSKLASTISVATNSSYIHDGSLGTTNQKIDITSGLLEIKGFSDGIMFYSGKSDTNSEYKSYTGIKYLKPDGTSGRYLDMMTDQKDYNYLSYSRDLSTKNTSQTHEVAVIGDIYDSRTGRTFFPKQIDMELSSFEKNARTYLAYSGSSYMFENQEISLNTNNKPISIFSGFTFGWSDYDSASASASDYDINFSYISNTDDELFSGGFLQYGSISFVLGTNIAGADNSICVKSVSLDKDGLLRGNTKDITPNHKDVVLREVWLHLY